MNAARIRRIRAMFRRLKEAGRLRRAVRSGRILAKATEAAAKAGSDRSFVSMGRESDALARGAVTATALARMKAFHRAARARNRHMDPKTKARQQRREARERRRHQDWVEWKRRTGGGGSGGWTSPARRRAEAARRIAVGSGWRSPRRRARVA